MDEIEKIGEIHTINDVLNFKLSIKTMAILAFVVGSFWLVVIIFMLGGVSNTMEIISGLFDSAKSALKNNKGNTAKRNVKDDRDKNIEADS